MSDNKIVAAILTVTVVASAMAYLKFGNASPREIMEQECHDKGMVLEETDFFELTCLPN